MERIRGRTLADWIGEDAPSPAAIVAAYADAARGLAAGHGVGVVHRDFKPANAMVTSHGRVVVLDFGLASAFEGEASTETAPATADASGSSASSSRSSGRSSGSLTDTGIVMGTPRYMAPEQHAAEPATPASDQYAWCVSLWEALCGEPPFVGADIAALARAKRAGVPRRHAALSARVHGVLARGLAVDPALRFASLTDLLTALEGPSRRRKVLGIGLVALALAAGGAALVEDRRPGLAMCETMAEEGDAAWSRAAIAELTSALSQREPAVSAADLEPIEARIVRFGADFDDARDRVCAGAPALPAAIAVARDACLSRARAQLDAALVTLRERGPDDLPWAFALFSLRSPLRCDGPDAEVAFVVDPRDGPDVDAVRAHVEGALASRRPRFPGWESVTDHALAVAEEIDDHALAAGALALRGRILAQEQRFEESADASALAAWRAHSAGDALLAAEILPHAITMLAAPGAPTTEIDRLIGVARQIAHDCGDPPRLHADIDAAQCWSLEMRGDTDRALTGYVAHIERLAAHPFPSAPEYLTYALWRMGQLQSRLDQPWAARETFQRALASMSESARQDDPMRHADLQADLSRAAFDCGDLPAAATSAALALEGYRGENGSAGYATRALAWYGYVVGARGQVDEGRAIVAEAIARQQQRGYHPMLGELLGELGFLQELAGDYEAAARGVEDVRVMLSDNPGVGPRSPIYHHSAIARLLAQAGRVDDASESLEKAHAALAKLAAVEGRDPFPQGSPIPEATAWVAAARGDWSSARASVSLALADPSLHAGTPIARGDLGKLYGLLARALAGEGELADAREIADLATATLAGAAPGFHRERAAVDRLRDELRER